MVLLMSDGLIGYTKRREKLSSPSRSYRPLVGSNSMQYPANTANICIGPSCSVAGVGGYWSMILTTLLEPDKVLHPLDPGGKPRPVRRFIQLLLQSYIVVRLAGRAHEGLGDRVAFAHGIVQEQVSCVDFARFIPRSCGCFLDTLLKQALEVALCWAQTVGGPAA